MEITSLHAQGFRRAGHVPAMFFKLFQNESPFELLPGSFKVVESRKGDCSFLSLRKPCCLSLPNGRGNISKGDSPAPGHYHQPLYYILQFPHVAGPGIIDQAIESIFFNSSYSQAGVAAEFLQKIVNKNRYILLPLPQGRGLKGNEALP